MTEPTTEARAAARELHYNHMPSQADCRPCALALDAFRRAGVEQADAGWMRANTVYEDRILALEAQIATLEAERADLRRSLADVTSSKEALVEGLVKQRDALRSARLSPERLEKVAREVMAAIAKPVGVSLTAADTMRTLAVLQRELQEK